MIVKMVQTVAYTDIENLLPILIITSVDIALIDFSKRCNIVGIVIGSIGLILLKYFLKLND